MKKMLYILVFLTLFIGIERINAYTEYKIGDVVPYNGMNFYVIKNSDSKEDTVTMLKAEPLSYEEVQTYSNGTGAQTSNQNGYGGIQFYYGSDCGYAVSSGCTTEFEHSLVKKVIDSWALEKISSDSLIKDLTNFEVRLLTYEDLTNNLGYEKNNLSTIYPSSNGETPSWVYNSNYIYWTMTAYNDSNTFTWSVCNNGNLYSVCLVDINVHGHVYDNNLVVRPVITLKKTALGDEDESIIDDNTDKKENSKIDAKDNIVDNKTNESKTTVKVDNTYMSRSIIIIILGFIIANVSVLIIYKLSNKKR